LKPSKSSARKPLKADVAECHLPIDAWEILIYIKVQGNFNSL